MYGEPIAQNNVGTPFSRDVRVLATVVADDDDLPSEAILKEARLAIDEDGADVIVLGNTGMSTVAEVLRERLEVPVVDPAVAGLTLATSLVHMGLTHSRHCYLPPLEKISEASSH